MKIRFLPAILGMLIVLGFDGCTEVEFIKAITVLGNVHMVEKRIAGNTFMLFDKVGQSDDTTAINGFTFVRHHPDCDHWIFSSGNDGTDKFFVNPLPAGAVVVRTEFHMFWPVCITESPDADFWGKGSYDAVASGDGVVHPVNVEWNNTCQNAFGGKDLFYAISFIISMPEGLDVGEKVFDAGSPFFAQFTPAGFQLDRPAVNCVTDRTGCGPLVQSNLPTFNLGLAGGTTFSGTLPAVNNGCPSNLVQVKNLELFDVVLSGNGNTVTLGAGKSTSAADLMTLYKADKPPLPVVITATPVLPNLSTPPTRSIVQVEVFLESSQ